MRKPTIILVLLLASVGRVTEAHAEVGAIAQGPIGVRVGDLELHPGVAAEVGYDSNYLQGSGQQRTAPIVAEDIIPTIRARLTPSLGVNTVYKSTRSPDLLPPRFDLSGKLTGHLDQLWALKGEFAKGATSKTLLDGDLNLSLDILPKRTWGGNLGLTVVRAAQPSNNPALSGNAFSRTLLGGIAELRWRPGMGNLDWSLGYAPRVTVFDESTFHLDVLEQSIQLKGRWLFLPRTALIYQSEARIVSYLNETKAKTSNSTPLSSLFGATGLITPKIGLTLLAGWKGTFLTPGAKKPDYDGPIGRAEAVWYFSGATASQSALRLTYERDTDISTLADYYELNRVQADLSLTLFQNLNLGARAGIAFIDHPGRTPANPTTTNRTYDTFAPMHEYRPEGRLFLEYHLTKNLSLTSNNQFTASPRNNLIKLDPTKSDAESQYDNLKFFRFVALLGASWVL